MGCDGPSRSEVFRLNRVFLIGSESVGFRLGGFLFSSRFLPVVCLADLIS